jgi:hypothetical protein
VQSGRRGPGRRSLAAAAVLLVVAAGVGMWRWDAAGDAPRTAPGLAVPSLDRPGPTGPGTGSATATTGAATGTPTGSPSPSTATSTATAGNIQPPPDPSPTAGPTTSAAPSGSRTPSLSPTDRPAPPAHDLVIRLALLSTGAVNVSVGGSPVGRCDGAGAPCSFAMRSGEAVALDPVDVVSSWGSGPCAGRDTDATCVFTAGDDEQFDLWVLRRL